MKLSRTTVLVTALTVVLTAALAITAIGAPPWAAPGPDSKDSGLIGTWYGHSDGAIRWLAVHTAGSNFTSGQMLMNWVSVAPKYLTYGDTYSSVTRLTPGHGVWEQIGKGQYKYTWYAYGIPDTGDPLYTLRVSGVAKNTDSDNVSIDFTYEVFDGRLEPHEISGHTPLNFPLPGTAEETRVPLVTP
jgi:hypothetical protein